MLSHNRKPESKQEGSASPDITISSIIRSADPDTRITGYCHLPDGRTVSIDNKGVVTVKYPDANTSPKTYAVGKGQDQLFWLQGDRVIVYNPIWEPLGISGYADRIPAFVLNIEDGSQQRLPDVCLADPCVDNHTNFTFVKLVDPGLKKEVLYLLNGDFIFAFNMDALDDYFASVMIEPKYTLRFGNPRYAITRDAHNLTSLENRLIAGVGHNDEIAALATFDLKLSLTDRRYENFNSRYYKCKACEPFVCGNGKFLAVYDRRHKSAFSIGTVNLDDAWSEFYKPFITIPNATDINALTICPVPHTPLFCFVSADNQLNVVNCDNKELFQLTLPLPFKKDLTVTGDGKIFYLTPKGEIAVLTYQPFVLESELSPFLTKDTAGIVKKYIGMHINMPKLEIQSVIAAMQTIGITQAKLVEMEKTQQAYFPFRKSKTIAKIDREIIKELLNAKNDNDRFHAALNYCEKHPERPFAKALSVFFDTLKPTKKPR
ncbi:MAG: hypothetical protein ACYCQI_15960 [Gammaproteobacteria bacterium]